MQAPGARLPRGPFCCQRQEGMSAGIWLARGWLPRLSATCFFPLLAVILAGPPTTDAAGGGGLGLRLQQEAEDGPASSDSGNSRVQWLYGSDNFDYAELAVRSACSRLFPLLPSGAGGLVRVVG